MTYNRYTCIECATFSAYIGVSTTTRSETRTVERFSQMFSTALSTSTFFFVKDTSCMMRFHSHCSAGGAAAVHLGGGGACCRSEYEEGAASIEKNPSEQVIEAGGWPFTSIAKLGPVIKGGRVAHDAQYVRAWRFLRNRRPIAECCEGKPTQLCKYWDSALITMI